MGAEIEKQKLESLIAELGVRATFRGQVLNPWSNWESGDLLIVPSSHEADGLVALEALALNIPILLSDIPEFRRFGLKDCSYCLDEVEFASTIEKNKFNIDFFRVGLDSRRRILEERAPLAIAKKWEVLLKNHSA